MPHKCTTYFPFQDFFLQIFLRIAETRDLYAEKNQTLITFPLLPAEAAECKWPS